VNTKKHPGFRILLCFALFALFVGQGSAARIVRSGIWWWLVVLGGDNRQPQWRSRQHTCHPLYVTPYTSLPVCRPLAVTLCTSLSARHPLHVILYTSLSERHSLHATLCTSISALHPLHVILGTSLSVRHSPQVTLCIRTRKCSMIYIGFCGRKPSMIGTG
jgi:hypothetical protein